MSPSDVRRAASALQARFDKGRREHLALWRRASREAGRVVDLCIAAGAQRVFQWGSVIRPERFRPYSDIDVAAEGLPDPEAIFRVQEQADEFATFPVHLVELEKIEPRYAESIRQTGKLVYARETGG